MSTQLENNKRIAKNTLLLYIRMILLMAVTLYTSRVILQVLGVTDFGIYNVVGGVVTMLGFVSSSLSGATSRFITFELGKGTIADVKKVFSCAVTVHYIMAIGIFILAETIGLWFVLNKMVIPTDRMVAAIWVYQCSIATFIVSILSVPYNALIIAHERMNAFAYISVFEAIAKLGIVLFLSLSENDRLIVYAILLLSIQIIIRMFYTIYCNQKFPESSAKWLWNKKLSQQIANYAGWTLNGNLAVIGYTQGINILLNLFFGPTVNAARGISVQIQSAINQFFGNFLMAVRPQITKSYAQENLKYMHSLILNSSRYAFFLVLLLSLPIFIHTEYILTLWLKNVPEHTANFTRLMILICMNEAFRNPTIMAIHATGDIKKFQIIEGTLLLTIVPIAYILLKFANISAEFVFIVYFSIELLTQFVRVWIVYPRIQLSRKKYISEILYPILKVMISTTILGYILYHFKSDSLFNFIVISLLCIISTIINIWTLGLSHKEKQFVLTKIKYIISK